MSQADVLVVGSGVAGLSAALRLAPRRVRLVTAAAELRSGSSPLAQGGIAAAVGPADSPEAHARDTQAAGAGLCDSGAVTAMTSAGALAVAWLREQGVRFDLAEGGEPALAREGAHGLARVLHAGGDAIGAELVTALGDAVRGSRHVEIACGTEVVSLILERGRVAGVLALDPDRRAVVHAAGAVVLATGGVGGLYAATTNPPSSIGEGLLLAGDAGARLIDLEFVQFHPTALACAAAPMPLLTEALRGEGARLLDGKGGRFLVQAHPLAELAPRDVVSLEVERAWQETGGVFLDARAIPGVLRRFPSVGEICGRAGFDLTRDLVPIRPAAHYHMGGIAVDRWGRTGVPGLWACGEVASSGAHGANRLASNSLLEAVVVASRLGQALARSPLPQPQASRLVRLAPRVQGGTSERADVRQALRACMTQGVGLLRTGDGLAAAWAELWELEREADGAEDRVAARACRAGRWIARAALARCESRGAHRRLDFPDPDPVLARRTSWTAALLDRPPGTIRRTAGAAPGV